MFTRDSVIISNNIKTPLTLISRAVGNILQLTYGQLIKSLFSNGEQGFAYDPNDLTTMFQDAAGTVPVTGAGQPVGLVLDKSRGLVVGVERLTNGDFSAGSAGWTVVGNDATHIITFANGTMRYQSDTATPVLVVQQFNTLTVGKWYEVTITISNYVSGALKSDGLGGLIFPSSTGTYKLRAIATSTTFNLLRQTPNVDITIDSVSIKELAGNHAYQSTSASRPILRQNAVTGANYLEFDGSDDFLQTNSIDFTATDKVSLFAGLYTSNPGVQFIMETSANYSVNVGAFELTISEVTSGGYTLAYRAANNTNQYSSQPIKPIPRSSVIAGKINMSKRVIGAEGGVLLRENAISTGNSYTGIYIGGALGSYPLYIGRRAGTSLPFKGHIYSLIGVGRLATDVETASIEKLIAKRVGVTLNV